MALRGVEIDALDLILYRDQWAVTKHHDVWLNCSEWHAELAGEFMDSFRTEEDAQEYVSHGRAAQHALIVWLGRT